MEGVVDRCPTGIEGFDKLCQGGFVRDSDNLIVGGPGTGKTTFLLQFLWNGVVKYNENGLYCSFEPDIVDVLNDSLAFGWDFTKLAQQDRIKFMKFSPHTSVEELKKELLRLISRYSIKRICFDPVSVFALHSGDAGKIRETLFDLSALMKRLKVTTLFADEAMESNSLAKEVYGEWNKTDILRFLSDSVVFFSEVGIEGQGDRSLRIVKMRRTNHVRAPVGMTIGQQGIEVFDISQA